MKKVKKEIFQVKSILVEKCFRIGWIAFIHFFCYQNFLSSQSVSLSSSGGNKLVF